MRHDHQHVNAGRQQVLALPNLNGIDSVCGLDKDFGAELACPFHEGITIVLPTLELKRWSS